MMERHTTWIGNLMNQLLGWLVLPAMEGVGLHPPNPARPIPDHIATELFIVFLSVAFFVWFRRKLSADNPGGLQLCFEQLLWNSFQVGIYDLLDEIVGRHGRKYLAMIGTVGLFVLFCNAISLIPSFTSPTAHRTVPLGAALAVFLYYHSAGIRQHGGVGYSKHFVGHAFAMPKVMWPIVVPLFVVIESVSHASRLLSLTARLWANMFASELLYLTFLGLTAGFFSWAWHWNKVVGVAVLSFPLSSPIVVPALFVVLHAAVALIQAFVFTLLPIVYVGGAVETEHE
ncbi:MAG: F0F1 ATP synthase subunit A [Terriglobia bacterium]